MTGFKVFNPNWQCKGFQYEVGKTYKHNGPISICNRGFHFCRVAADCFNYYSFNPNNKVAEVEALGLVESDDTKSVTDEIKIVREIPWTELLEIVNTGKSCTGFGNSGNHNSGNHNSGDRNSGGCNSGNHNSGDRNSGYRNSGYRNSGNCNSGGCNSGNHNSGNHNSGNHNSGNHNSGDWNSGDWNSGFFSTVTPTVSIFEKPTDLTYEQACNLKGIRALNWRYENNWWVYSENMSDEEKAAHPEHETLGGYLKSIPFKDACALMWENMSDDEKQSVREIPNFSADIFERITGIKA